MALLPPLHLTNSGAAARILAVDASEKRVERARQRAEMLGFAQIRFSTP